MSDEYEIERRTIAELAARYTLEPELRDLFVEGVRDRRTYLPYLNDLGHRDVTVFPIDSIEVSRQIVESYGLGEGNRNRVTALAMELDLRFTPELPRVRCIVDSDFDFILNSFTASRHLLYTDCTSVDLYTFEKSIFIDGPLLDLGLTDEDVDKIFSWLIPILKDVFVIRTANQLLELGMSILLLTRCCSIVESGVDFDRYDFVGRCLQSNGKTNEQARFESTCSELDAIQLDDDRKVIHSDDYLELVGWYLHHRYRWQGYRRGERSILGVLESAINSEALSQHRLFARLSEIYA